MTWLHFNTIENCRLIEVIELHWLLSNTALSGSGEPAEGAEDAVQSGAADSSPNDSLVEDVTEGAVSEPVVVVEGITTSPADTSEQDDSTITGKGVFIFTGCLFADMLLYTNIL